MPERDLVIEGKQAEQLLSDDVLQRARAQVEDDVYKLFVDPTGDTLQRERAHLAHHTLNSIFVELQIMVDRGIARAEQLKLEEIES